MKKGFLFLCLLSGLFLVGCQMTGQGSATQTKQVQSDDSASDIDWAKAGPDAQKYKIDFEQVQKAVENGAKFYDVRSSDEYKVSNFGITENLPITELQAGNLPDLDKDTPIYVHCLKGIRSAQAVKILRDAGFTHVYDMGGIEHVQAIGGKLKE